MKPKRKKRALIMAPAALLVAMMAIALFRQGSYRSTPKERPILEQYAGSESCRDCHGPAFNLWTNSHHARAERAVDPQLDRVAFEPDRVIEHGTQKTGSRARNGRMELLAPNATGTETTFIAERVIGVEPLIQFLCPAPGGRWQAAEVAFDPARKDWFDVFGAEDRRPGEWGHWTGRGMTWNSMCASCHNTALRKNYDAKTDSYATAKAERGVGCEACHGPMKAHVEWRRLNPASKEPDPTARKLSKEQMLDACGACHARRGELTGDFAAGDKFFDHYQLAIPDESDVYWPDGQVRDENFEFASFLGSRMHAAGVRCGDCHEPHSAKLILPGDALCLRCHAAPIAPAPRIEPVSHTRHAPGAPGSFCVDCHMPQTTYMQRHPRRDHGFTIPDPLLTKEHGIPNACNRCHKDRDAEWSLQAVDRWHGERMNRPSRARAQALAEARAGSTNAPGKLIPILLRDKVPLWRASAARLLRPWAGEAAVRGALLDASIDPEPLVRANVVYALQGAGETRNVAVETALARLFDDPVRAVRVEAAWAARAWIGTNSLAARDLLDSIRQNIDQPSGAHQMGLWALDRGNPTAALPHFQRAVGWDGGSPPFREALALTLSLLGRPAEAVRELEAACRLAPKDARFRYQLGLALNEAGRSTDATAALQEAVRLDPALGPAWYNLGLARAGAEELELALEALWRAEGLEPNNPRAPYARATVLARMQRVPEARAAAQRALEIDPSFRAAAELSRALSRN